MAISGQVYAPSQFRLAIAEETTFGTPNTTQSAFYELDILSPTQPDMASGVVEDVRKRADGKRVMSHTDTYRASTGGLYVIPFECIVTNVTADLLIYGVMQDIVSEEVGTPFQKIFEFDPNTTGPDFSANAGKFFTVLGADPAEPWRATSCVLRNVTFSSNPGTNGGRLTASGEFVTGFDIVIAAVTATPASWVSPGVGYFPFQVYTACTVGGAAMVPYSYSVTFNNGAVRVGHAAGVAQTYHMPLFECNAELTAKLDANTVDLIDGYRLNPAAGSAETTVIMSWGGTGVTGFLSFVMNAIYTAPNSRDFGAESGVGVTLAFQAVDDGSNEAIEVFMASGVDRAWT